MGMPSSEQIYAGEEYDPFMLDGDPDRPVALCVHGFTGTPAEMRPLAHALNADGWSVTCDRLPGFGREMDNLASVSHHDWLSVARERWKLIQTSDKAPNKIDKQKRILIGFSMGGAIATILASELAPDQLILIAPFTRINSWLSRIIPVAQYVKPQYYPFASADFDDPKVRESLKRWDELDLDDPEIQKAIRDSVTLPMSAINELRTVGLMALTAAESVHCPVLIAQGTEDPSVDYRTTRQLVTKLGGRVQYHEMAGDHHVARLPENLMPLIASSTCV